MSRQRFKTTDRLKLEVLADPGWSVGLKPYLRDYAAGDALGRAAPYFWTSPLEGTIVTYGKTGAGVPEPYKLRLEAVAGQAGVHFTSQRIPRDPAATHTAINFKHLESSNVAVTVNAAVELYDDTDTLLGTVAATASVAAGNTASAGPAALGAATYLKYRLNVSRGGAALLSGDYAHLPAFDLNLVQGTAAEATPGFYAAAPEWMDILGDAGDLTVERNELDLGILTATLYSEALDPATATATTIREGKRIRLNRQPGGTPDLLFDGEIQKATVAYDLKNPDPDKRTKITLTAVDNIALLTAAPRPDGVSSVAELAHVLEGAGVPWVLNGNAGHIPVTPPIITRNANAKALDQVALVRDSVLGYAWVDRTGALNVYDADQIPPLDPAAAVLDETAYVDVDVDYDTDRCINTVLLKYLRLDPVTGETEEIDYGPYVDLHSRQLHGPHEATFTVQGLDEDPAALQAYADAIFAANATPARRLNGATLNLTTDAAVDAWAALDLYEARRVVNARAGLDETARVVGVKHTIKAGKDSSWLLEVDFAAEGVVAAPQAVPSPPATGAATLAQLLRPVGEVTGFLGLPSMVWPGWLLLNGQALTAGEYPELEEWLAEAGLPTTAVPDLTDYIPVGAGIKALGAKSGSWTKTLSVSQLPSHDHPGSPGINRRAAAGTVAGVAMGSGTAQTDYALGNTGNRGGGDPIDITPKVFGLYWVVRARSGA